MENLQGRVKNFDEGKSPERYGKDSGECDLREDRFGYGKKGGVKMVNGRY